MASKVRIVKEKSVWKQIQIPASDDFDGLLDFQELSDYELIDDDKPEEPEQQIGEVKNKKKKKRKKKKTKEEPKELEEVEEAEEGASDTEGQAAPTIQDQQHESEGMETWKELGVSPFLLQALREEGFKEPTPIQAASIPHAIHHRLDIIGAAETGSGKTLAFGLPILEHILQNPREEEEGMQGPHALILEPTRELAMQVHKHLKVASRHTDIKIVTVVGGMAQQKQCRLLKRHPQVIVATPGRLWELIEAGDSYLKNLNKVEQFVLDEADRMIEKGHFEELHKIIGFLNQSEDQAVKRQHYVFSATLTLDHAAPVRPTKKKRKTDSKDAKQKLDELVQDLGIQEKPKVIDLTRKEVTVDTLTETRIHCHAKEKDLHLYYILRKYGGRTLVFCNSKDCIRRLVSVFSLLGRDPLPLHSDMHQRQRLKNLDRFAERKTSLLLASDVAARGLDIKGVDHVIHYQVPFTIENYVHRSGRTARACQEGLSVILISPEETKVYKKIVKMKQGEDLPLFPLESDVIKTLKSHVALATEIDTAQHRVRKAEVNSNWMQKAAEEMDIELDDDLMDEVGNSKERQKEKDKLKHKKQILAEMLKGPLLPTAFSCRYPTKSGQLVMPKQFTQGSAVKDCLKRKKPCS